MSCLWDGRKRTTRKSAPITSTTTPVSTYTSIRIPSLSFLACVAVRGVCSVVTLSGSVSLTESTQLEDPRVQWQREQERMLREYLSVAKEALSAQKEIYQVKEERLRLAQQQYKQLNDAWRDKSSSQTSCKTVEH